MRYRRNTEAREIMATEPIEMRREYQDTREEIHEMRVQGEICEPVYARVSPCQSQVQVQAGVRIRVQRVQSTNREGERGEERETQDGGRVWTACRAGSRGGSAAECTRGDRGAGGGERRYWSAQAVVVGDTGEGDSESWRETVLEGGRAAGAGAVRRWSASS